MLQKQKFLKNIFGVDFFRFGHMRGYGNHILWALKNGQADFPHACARAPGLLSGSVCVPHVKGVSEHLQKSLRKEQVKLIYKRGRTVGTLLCNTKAKRQDRKNVIYKGKCKTCGKEYIGETSQWLETRKQQHKQCCRAKDEKNGFAHHLKQYPDHEIDWENFEVIDSARNWKERKMKEAVYIKQASNGGNLQNVLNIENGETMDTCWTSILSLID